MSEYSALTSAYFQIDPGGLTVLVFAGGNQYLTGLTLYFIGYVIFEVRQASESAARRWSYQLISSQIPCNIILKRTSPRVWLPTLTIAWGIVATLLGVVHNLAGFFIARFFLGVTESGLFPGVVYYFSM